jgi:hypothetical protein
MVCEFFPVVIFPSHPTNTRRLQNEQGNPTLTRSKLSARPTYQVNKECAKAHTEGVPRTISPVEHASSRFSTASRRHRLRVQQNRAAPAAGRSRTTSRRRRAFASSPQSAYPSRLVTPINPVCNNIPITALPYSCIIAITSPGSTRSSNSGSSGSCALSLGSRALSS